MPENISYLLEILYYLHILKSRSQTEFFLEVSWKYLAYNSK